MSNQFDACARDCFPCSVDPSVCAPWTCDAGECVPPEPTAAPTAPRTPNPTAAPTHPKPTVVPTIPVCRWRCEDLEYDSDEQLGQKANCGVGCFDDVPDDIFGVKYSELFLKPYSIDFGGVGHSYAGQGIPNQFHICRKACFPDTIGS